MVSDESFERAMPPRFTAYRRLLSLFSVYMDSYELAFKAKFGRAPDRGYVPFDSTVRQPLRMPDRGIDAVGLFDMSLAEMDTVSEGTINDHHFATVGMYLFQDGSPRVLEGDEIEATGVSSNWYYVILAAEFPPALIQADHFSEAGGAITPESLSAEHMHFLSDLDCEQLLQFLENQESHFDFDPAYSSGT